MAVDEAILKARIENHVPNTVRFYCWNPSAVSVGRFQNIENEVHLDHCKKHGVDVVRRITGGGTVYHDAEDEITYSVVVNKEDLKAIDIATVYAKIYGGLIETLRILGLKADFEEGNLKTCPNLTVRGKKISGSAQSHRKGVVLQHGTLLVDVELEKMFTFLRVPWAKTRLEIIRVAEHKITSINKEMRKGIPIERVNEALVKGFRKALNIELVNGELTPFERELAEELSKEKYDTDEWNFHGRSTC